MTSFKKIILFSTLLITNLSWAQETPIVNSGVYHSISDGLKEPEKVEILELQSVQDLDSLNYLTEFVKLKSLSLIDFHFTTAPEAIARISWLKELKFIKDDFYTIPTSYAKLQNLEKVEFIYDTHLNVESALNFVNKLPHLKELRIEGLPGPSFSENTLFPSQLRVLSLRNNHLNLLPAGISKLDSLEILDVGNNEFFELPSFMENLTQLNTLYLDQQPFLRFDMAFNSINRIKALKNLHLEGNHLKPQEVYSLKKEHLYRVFLDEKNLLFNSPYQPHINLYLPEMPMHSEDIEKASYKIKINKK